VLVLQDIACGTKLLYIYKWQLYKYTEVTYWI